MVGTCSAGEAIPRRRIGVQRVRVARRQARPLYGRKSACPSGSCTGQVLQPVEPAGTAWALAITAGRAAACDGDDDAKGAG